MTFRLTEEQIIPSWKTCVVEVTFAPKTGSKRPWELHGCFSYPHSMRVFWGSYKTEEAAQKAQAKKQAQIDEKYKGE